MSCDRKLEIHMSDKCCQALCQNHRDSRRGKQKPVAARGKRAAFARVAKLIGGRRRISG